jgi:hypothetical protein
LKADSQREGSTLEKESWAREVIEKMSIRNGLRRSLKETISTMQLTRQLVEKGLSLRHSMKPELSLNDEALDASLKEDISNSIADYTRHLEAFKISTKPIVVRISPILAEANDEFVNLASNTTSEMEVECSFEQINCSHHRQRKLNCTSSPSISTPSGVAPIESICWF